MAAPICLHLSFTVIILNFMFPCFVSVPLISLNDILNASTSVCSVVIPNTAQTDGVQTLFSHLADVSFVDEIGVVLSALPEIPQTWPNGRPFHILGNVPKEELEHSVLIFKRVKVDRTCLLMPGNTFVTPTVVAFSLSVHTQHIQQTLDDLLLEFINKNCGTFRNLDGSLNLAGIHRQDILDNLFSVSALSQTRRSLQQCVGVGEDTCMLDDSGAQETDSIATASAHDKYQDNGDNVPGCEKIDVPTTSNFFHEYLSRSKPVIITGAINHWPAFQKWTHIFLKEQYGDRKVHIKMTPDGQYEGVEPASLWEDHKNFSIPRSVYEKLPFPDLVVVRPASMEIQFSDFLDLVENISSGVVENMSAYLEYSSISDYFPRLREDIEEMPFFRNVLKLKHLNIWLSDGNTLGKLHFDPFDNFLCQISGEKEVTLFDPHDNTRLYEGHIQEAMLTYDSSEKQFYRQKLLDSTSMVMSPVDMQKPDLQRFPKFEKVRPLKCTIRAGEVLYMPSFWWHEVQSKPSNSEKRNLAVNFWYEPFLTRDFPCPECSLDVNSKYMHLL